MYQAMRACAADFAVRIGLRGLALICSVFIIAAAAAPVSADSREQRVDPEASAPSARYILVLKAPALSAYRGGPAPPKPRGKLVRRIR